MTLKVTVPSIGAEMLTLLKAPQLWGPGMQTLARPHWRHFSARKQWDCCNCDGQAATRPLGRGNKDSRACCGQSSSGTAGCSYHHRPIHGGSPALFPFPASEKLSFLSFWAVKPSFPPLTVWPLWWVWRGPSVLPSLCHKWPQISAGKLSCSEHLTIV